jgi:hypothetical protein
MSEQAKEFNDQATIARKKGEVAASHGSEVGMIPRAPGSCDGQFPHVAGRTGCDRAHFVRTSWAMGDGTSSMLARPLGRRPAADRSSIRLGASAGLSADRTYVTVARRTWRSEHARLMSDTGIKTGRCRRHVKGRRTGRAYSVRQRDLDSVPETQEHGGKDTVGGERLGRAVAGDVCALRLGRLGGENSSITHGSHSHQNSFPKAYVSFHTQQ